MLRSAWAMLSTAAVVAGAVAVTTTVAVVTQTPSTASAAVPCDGSRIYGLYYSSGNIFVYQIDPATGSPAAISNALVSYTGGQNALGISTDGKYAFFSTGSAKATGNVVQVVKWDLSSLTGPGVIKTGATLVAPTNTGGFPGITAGAIDPVTGYYYYGAPDPATGLWNFYAYNVAADTNIGYVGSIAGAGGVYGGDITFDTSGNLLLFAADTAVAANRSQTRVNVGVMPTTAQTYPTTIPSTNLGSYASTTAWDVEGVAVTANGTIYGAAFGNPSLLMKMVSGQMTSVALMSGSFPMGDLASCVQVTGQLKLQKNIGSRVNASDQFTLGISPGAATATTTGSTTGVQSAVAGPVIATSGTVYTLTETSSPTALSSYGSVLTCTDVTNNVSVPVTPTGTGTYTMTYPAQVAGITPNVTCTFTNYGPPTLTVNKTLSQGRYTQSDQVTVQIRTGGSSGTVVNSTSSSTTTGVGVTVDAGTGTTGTFLTTNGTQYTVTEAAGNSGTSLTNYTATITCTDPTGLQTGLPTNATYNVATGFNITVVDHAQVSCTINNVKNINPNGIPQFPCETGFVYMTSSGATGNLYKVNLSNGTTTLMASNIDSSTGANPNGLAIGDGGASSYWVVQTGALTTASTYTIKKRDNATGVITNLVASAGGIVAASAGGFVRGGINSTNGILYFSATQTASTNNHDLYAYDLLNNNYIGYVGTVTLAAGGGNGDLVFDQQGNLLLVASNGTGSTVLVRVANLPKTGVAGVTNVTARGAVVNTLATITTAAQFNGITFDRDGYLYMNANTGTTSVIYKYDPDSGLPVAPTTTTVDGVTDGSVGPTGVDLADCDSPGAISLKKNVVGRVNSTDQFGLVITTASLTNSTSGNAGTTAGTDTGLQDTLAEVAGPIVGVPNIVYTLTETATGAGALLTNYVTTISCLDVTHGTTLTPTLSSQGVYTLTFPTAGADGILPNVVCTYTNTPRPQITLTKALGSARVNAGDQFTVNIRTGSATGTVVNATTNSTTTGTGSTVTAGTGTTGTYVGTAGTTYYLNESSSGGTNLLQYSATIACTDAAGLMTDLPSGVPVGTAAQITPVAQSRISCTITNSAIPPTITVNKALGSARSADTDQFTVNIRTGGVAGTVVNSTTSSTTTGTGSTVDTGTGTTGLYVATVGTTYTINESTSGTTNFNQYTRTITCTDATGVQTGLPTNAALGTGVTVTPIAGASIGCTITNTATAPIITLNKALASARQADTDQFNVAIRTGSDTGTVVSSTSTSTTTGTGSTVTAGTGTTGAYTATLGTTYYLNEIAAGTTTLGNYAKTISCTDANGLQTGLPTNAALGTAQAITPVAGSNISCTLTNRLAAPVVCASNTIYATTGGQSVTPTVGGLGAVNLTTAAVTNIGFLPVVNNALALNASGTLAYAVQWVNGNQNSGTIPVITRYDVATGTSTTFNGTSIASTLGSGVLRGGINPLTGVFYYAGTRTSDNLTVDVYAFDTNTNTAIGLVANVLNSPGSGDLAFDNLGNMYMVNTAGGTTTTVVRVGQMPTALPSLGNVTPTVVTNVVPTGSFGGIAFGADGYIYISGGGNLVKIDPNTGAQIGAAIAFSPASPGVNDLASCSPAGTIRAQKTVSGRAQTGDQFTITITPAGGGNTTTTSGSATGAQGVTAGPVFGVPGTTYTVTETSSGTTNLLQYTRTLTCVDENTGQSVATTPGTATATSAPFTFVFPAAQANGTTAKVLCTFTNGPAAPQITLNKALGTNRVADTDQFVVELRTGSATGTVVGTGTTGGTGSAVTGGTTGAVAATTGTTYYLTESASGSTNLAQYNATVTCTDLAGIQTTGLPSNAPLTPTVVPVAGANISCTINNAAKAPTIVLNKALGTNRVANTDQFTVNLRTGSATGTVVGSGATGGTGSAVTGGTTGNVTATAGTTYFLTESASGTTNLAQYNATVTCTDLAGIQTTGLPSNAPLTPTPTVVPVAGASISCTINNAAINPQLTLNKALGTNRVADSDQFTVNIRTGSATGTVVNATATSTSTGTGSTVTAGTGTTGTFTAAAGTTYFLNESAAGTANLSQYTSTITCTDAAGLQTGLPTNAALGAALQITPVAGANVSCTITNAAINPQLTLNKALGTVRVANTDQFSVAIRTGSGSGPVVSTATTGGTGSAVTGGTTTSTVTAGTQYFLTEAASGTTNLNQYTSTITCTDVNGIQTTGLPSSAPLTPTPSVTPVAGANISCTITNNAKAPTIQVDKSFGSSRGVVTDQFTVQLRTGGAGGTVLNTPGNETTAGTGSTVDPGTGTTGVFAATAGTTYTVTEAPAGTPPAVAANYATRITCTDQAGLQTGLPNNAVFTGSLDIAPVAGAVITCSLTNSFVAPTVVIAKQSVGAIGTFDYALTGASPTTDTITTQTAGVTLASTLTHTGSNGVPVTIAETPASGTWTTAWSCTNATGGTIVSGSGTGLTLNAAQMVAGAVWTCAYTNTFVAPSVVTTKSSNPASGTSVATGSTITYSIQTVVTNGPTVAATTINDTLTGATFGSITSTSAGLTCTTPAATPFCTLPAGTANGTYTVVYAATVTAAAGGTVTNHVVDSNNSCTTATCDTTHRVPSVVTTKSSSPASGTSVATGSTITYSIQTVVSNGPTVAATTINDTLTGATFGSITSASAGLTCTTPSATPFCTLPAGTANGTYTVVYTATVTAAAGGTVTNHVVDSNNSCTTATCDTTHRVPSVVTTKSSNPASGTSVATGSTITYSIQTVVSNGPTVAATTINDTLAGATFGSIQSASAGLTCTTPSTTPFCTLPAGTANGTYTVVYTATVTAAAGGTVTNHVVDSNNTCTTATCDTTHRVPQVVTTKSSNPASGTTVATGSTITYTIQTVVTNGPTVNATTINDTLTGATFASITSTSAGLTCTTPAGTPFCTLPAGTANGTYTVVYTATVTATGGSAAHNVVTDSNGSCTPLTCTTDNPVPSVVTTKVANPISGTAVATGSTITYTIQTVVSNGPTVSATTINDTLAGATFGSISSASAGLTCTTPATTPFCTLPAGTANGTYTVVYTATVTATSGQNVTNHVVDSNNTCTPATCDTTHPVASISTTKTASPASGTSVATGSTITYTITTTVANGPTAVATTINDTLVGATFGSITSASAGLTCTTPAATPFCTLPAGTANGTYTVVYTATVTATAGQNVTNHVVDSNNSCTVATCDTTHPVPQVTTTKSSNPASGTPVATGSTILYTVQTVVSNGPTVSATTINDTLAGATFGSIQSVSSGLTCMTPAATPFCTLPAGAANGTYTVVYSATVTATAGQNVTNHVVDSNNSCTPATCDTTNPVPQVTTTKSSNPASGASVATGSTITYSIQTVVSNGPTVTATTINDTLAGATFGSIVSSSAGLTCTTPAATPFCTLPAGTANGTYTVVYTATVTATAGQNVTNHVVDSNNSCTTATCDTTHPVPQIVTTKTSSPVSGTSVATGSTITYSIQTVVSNGPTVAATSINDTLAGATFGSIVSATPGLTCTTPAATPFCTLPAGTANGTYTVVYSATVTATAGQNVTNHVVDSNNSCTPATCDTTNPVPSVVTTKSSSPVSGTSVATGSTITYSIQTVVSNGPTVAATSINDTLAGATFGSIVSSSAGLMCTTPAATPFCTLPAGTANGTYTVVYTATVTATAGQSVTNHVVDSNNSCTTATCDTTHPVPQIVTTKTSSPVSGTTVATGSTVTYTITTTVSNGPTVTNTTIDDTLTGAAFGSITSASTGLTCTTPSNSPFCTLPAGSANGTYTVVYTATVTAAAGGSAHNVVTDSNGSCTTATCTTDHPVPSVVTTKSANPISGTSVSTGDTITYSITTVVTNGPTVTATTINDTLAGAAFGSITSSTPGLACTTPTTTPFCTLPAGSASGTYTVVYTATVTATSGQNVTNHVVDSNNICTLATCDTTHPVASISTTKTASPATGTSVATGSTITYTITTTVANGPTATATTINDTLVGATFGSIVTATPGLTCSTPASTPFCTLPAGTASGTYTVVYTATVTATAGQSVTNHVVDSNNSCTVATCDTTHPVPQLTTTKTSNPASGTPVATGSTISYTITTVVSNGPTVVPTTINDTLAGATFGSITSSTPGLSCTTPSTTPFCTLPSGAANGTYTVVYTAVVTATAGQNVTNHAVDSNNSCTPATCDTTNPVPSVVTTKSADPVSGTAVATGSTITYTIQTVVSNGPTVAATTINDTLVGASFGSITSASAGLSCTTPADTPFCTLPAGTANGTYTVVYTATVTAAAGQNVTNHVVDSNNTCTPATCDTTHPVPQIVTTKAASPASGTSVATGSTISYTIQTVVSNGPTVASTTISDTLAGATFGSITSSTPGLTCTTPADTPFCTLPAGSASGTYTVVYTATVTAAAGQSVTNHVVDSNNSCTVATCDTTHPVPQVTTVKTASPASGTSVATGSTIAYAITTTVTNGPTVAATTINDTLVGATFGSITSATAGLTCTTPADTPFCTLPVGTANGTYTVVYTATVTATAGQNVTNHVVDSNNSCTPATCDTTNPVPSVVTTKSSNPASGTSVATGSTISYTIQTVVSNGPTVVATTINDTLVGASFGSITSASAGLSCTTPADTPFCTLPAGTANGTYTVVYTATVTATAGQNVTNHAVDSNNTCTPTTCDTTNAVPQVVTTKTANPPSGTAVATGSTITYSIQTVVSNGPTVVATTINDTLVGASFGSITSASAGLTCTTPADTPFCTLPAGTANGTYTVVYTATVTATSGQNVTNHVVDSNNTCTPATCDTTHPVAAISTVKSSNPPSGTPVSTGDVITYTITTTVANGPTATATTINDTLVGASFGSITSASAGLTCTTPASTPFCTLPAGTANGTYTVVYTATVTATAGQNVTNHAVDSNNSCTPATCDTTNPVPQVTTTKTSNPASGTSVSTGDTITYTIQTVVSNGPTAVATTINDTLAGATFVGLTAGTSAQFNCTTPAATPFCTLPAGTPNGTYAVVYTATVTATAGQNVTNHVVDSNNSCTTATCDTTNPVPQVVTTKTANPASGTSVATGSTISYTIQTVVSNGPTAVATTINDTLVGASFGSITSSSAGLSCTTPADTPFCTLPAGTGNGTYTVVYTATATATAGQNVTNHVVDSNNTCTVATCDTTNPVPSVVTTKLASPVSGTSVSTGDVISYTIQTVVSNGPTAVATTITDSLVGASFGSITSSSAGLTCTTPADTPFCTLPAGTANGTYTVVYTATVTATAGQNVTNHVVDSNNTCTLATCDTTHPVPQVTTTKTADPVSGSAVATGATISYTITTTVANGPTAVATTINDTLAGATFGSIVSATPGLTCTTPADTPFCTLPAGAPNGTYTVVYTATVTASSGQTVTNHVVDSNNTCTPATCDTTHPVAAISTVKTSNPASGTPVSTGDVITYTITTTVANGPTATATTINDTLVGATFGSITSSSAGLTCTTPSTTPFCTLPAGTANGTYTVVYTATVTATAGQNVTNHAVDSNNSCTPATCDTTNPVPQVTTTKASSPASGTSVSTGDTITYTITTTVANGPTAVATTINDTLAGATFVGLTAGTSAQFNCTTPAATPFCTLPAGTPNGTYTVVYTATVTATAGQNVTNHVVDSNNSCTTATCDTTNPVPQVTTTKTSSPASGTSVSTGDVITYTITTTVANGPTAVATTINDTLVGASFGSITSSSAGLSCTTPADTPFCTLPAGSANGTYTVVYTATVTATAGQNVTNHAVDSNNTCTPATCDTTNAVPQVTTIKTSNPASGTSVATGDTVTYTITTTVANGPTAVATTINDTLVGATFGSITSASAGLSCTTPADTPFCTLPAGTANGTYTVVYTATVTATAGQNVTNHAVDSNNSCTPATCDTTNPVPQVVTTKTANPPSGTAVATGSTITYSIQTVVSNGPTVVATTINDTLVGASFGSITSASVGLSCTTPADTPFCTLPAGSANGTYTVVYTATVTASSGQNVTNHVVDSNNTCTPATCDTTHPVAAISTVKTSNPPSGTSVATGDAITYTITTTVANGPTAVATTINDTLVGATFGSITSSSAGLTCTTPADTPFCTLPAGTANGTYTVVYTATVTATAGQSVTNHAVDSNNSCTPATCDTTNPVPQVTTTKTSNPASGTSVSTGSTITYTITTTVANGPTVAATTINDTLAGATFVGLTAGTSAQFNCTTPAATPFCTLPAGTPNGTYTVVYTATVTATAGQNVTNHVVDSNNTCTPATCDTTNPVPQVVTTKTANPASGTSVATGSTISYTITTVVSNGPTVTATTINDTLVGATFGSITSNTTGLTCTTPADTPFCTLPAGTANGTYTVVYTATVTATAGQSVTNHVVDSNNTCTPATCDTTHPVAAISTVKTSNPPSGTSVATGDVITYTITTTVANGPTATATTINDTLAGATFGSIVSATTGLTCTTPSTTPFCTLPAGAANGTYTVVYTAVVTATAGQSVTNHAVDSNNSCTPATCDTTNPVPSVVTTKSADPVSGTAVATGSTITYTIQTVVSNGPTVAATTINDTLVGASFGSITTASAGLTCTTPADTPFCTLPAGTANGTYTVVYTATVTATAGQNVTNHVVDSNNTCTPATCDTTHPVAAISTVKTSNPPSGTSVSTGDVITYTITTTVANGPTATATTINDTLVGASFGSITSSTPGLTCTTPADTPFCTLPAGTANGTYTVVYTATVTATAGQNVTNHAVDSNNTCTPATCDTTNPVPQVTTVKTANPASGTSVSTGDVITYTITTTVANGPTATATTINDTLVGASFGSITSATAGLTCTTPADTPFCSLPAGTANGTYTVVYTATVTAAAGGTVTNHVVDSNNSCTPATCDTTNPVPQVTTTKLSNPASGTSVSTGDVITYTITTTVTNGPIATATTINDTLIGASFGSITSSSAGLTCTTPADTPFCTLPAGTANGTYTVVYTATVTATAGQTVTNHAVDSNNSCRLATCDTTHPVPSVTTTKTADPATGTAVSTGDTITYTITTTVANGPTAVATTINDTLNGATFGSITSASAGLSCTTPADTPFCTLPAGSANGTYTVVYTATVTASSGQTVTNHVVDSNNTCTPATCDTTHPVAAISTVKTSNPASGTPVSTGDVITYTITTTVANGPTAVPTTINDTLVGASFGSIVSASAGLTCTTPADTPFCSLPAGTANGTYTVVYTATVTATAGQNVTNHAVDSNNTCTPATCDTTDPVPQVTTTKSSSPASGTSVATGSTITYTITTTVANGPTAVATTINDTLAGATFVGLATGTSAQFSCTTPSSTPFCTLPAGTPNGTYTVVYTATVTATAGQNVTNHVVDSNNSCRAATCDTSNPVPSVTTTKTSSPATGTSVSTGDTVTYTITTVVSNGPTAVATTINDTLAGATFVGLSAGTSAQFNCTTPASTPFCTLPAGTANGTYTVVYTATVTATAGQSVTNHAVDSVGTCTSATCDTTNPVPSVITVKTANPASGTTVSTGDTITYTITTTVSNGPTAVATTINDTLAGATFGSITSSTAGLTCTTPAATPFCTLPAGTANGTYTVVYTATVTATAGQSVTNHVVDSNNSCTAATCDTTNPVPQVTTVKSSNPVSGTSVTTGSTITYTITTTVANGPTARAMTINDTLTGATFVGLDASTSAAFTCTTPADTPFCTLPAGTPSGTYIVVYTATVTATGGQSAHNVVTDSEGGCPVDMNIRRSAIEALDPSCTTDHPVDPNPPVLDTVKTVTTVNGQPASTAAVVGKGDVVVYTISVTNTGQVEGTTTLTDQVPAHTVYSGSGEGWSCAAPAPAGTACTQAVTVPAGATVATTFTVTVNVDTPNTTVTQIVNTVTTTFGTCSSCTVSNPLKVDTVTETKVADLAVVKTVDRASAPINSVVVFTVKLTNLGVDPATGVTLTEIPSGLNYVSHVATQGSYDPATQVWTVGNLAVNQTVELAISMRVVTNVATNAVVANPGNEIDPNLSNNRSQATVTVPDLPKTGIDVLRLTQYALTACGIGLALVVIGRRRRQRRNPAH